MTFKIPDFCVVLLVGPSGCGKSSFAAKHFLPSEVLSSDWCRAAVSDDETAQHATSDAFELLHTMLKVRLKNRRLCVIDATNVQSQSRREIVKIAQSYHALTYAIVFSLPDSLCFERNQNRANRDFGIHVIRRQNQELKRSAPLMQKEGIRNQFWLKSVEDIDAFEIVREPLFNDKRELAGPFDIIGDVHGCYDELTELFDRLGYRIEGTGEEVAVIPPEGRTAIFLGDLVDRGPKSMEALKLAMSMVNAGTALCIPGNHDEKFYRYLGGRDVQIKHGLAETIEQLEKEPPEFRDKLSKFLEGLVSHYWLDGGKLCVAHAGMKEEMIGRSSRAVREFAMYGETTGETDEFGLPVRYQWAADYRGRTKIVYGHTPVPMAEWLNNTICLDTGCVFGGKLTALRYPEMTLIDVPAKETYAESAKPLELGSRTLQHTSDDVLDISDILGRRIIHTRVHGNVTIREENSSAALEAMSRFAANPKWLVYLPPTMSPCGTSEAYGYLERPEEAFAYFKSESIDKVVCEEKHMGSRAVAIVCRDAEAAKRRFGILEEESGIVYTRTGRRFFDDLAMEAALLSEIREAANKTDFWARHSTDWMILDCELMPWSAKAQELLRTQYALVGSASSHALKAAHDALHAASMTNPDVTPLLQEAIDRREMADRFVQAYRHYCWEVSGPQDLKLAPFHLLATEGAVHDTKSHEWHMTELAGLCEGGTGILMQTPWRTVDLSDEAQVGEAVKWWEELTAKGGEGMVVKPLGFTVRGQKGLAQPAVKCRGPEYLRIIYGPEYLRPENLSRLRKRGLAFKRSLALREYALGLEALHRFVEKEPLRRVHECAFGVLAMESEPVDPRL
ncbi:MAG: polynucleotide kinase-phosphatase [Fimbriimonadaceae bacterium]|nr:polynucleotide kinase-phosphatase [Fimbriimonadaceae bacterium]